MERQLETAKTEVTKPFAQEAELAEKLERLSALNALLNMDEKGDDAIGMDDAVDTEIKNAVSAADEDAQNDEKAKRLLGNKIILAHILVKTVDEFIGIIRKMWYLTLKESLLSAWFR